MNNKIILSSGMSDKIMVIFIQLPKNDYVFRKKINEMYSLQWSATKKMWYIPDEKFQLHYFMKLMKGLAWIDYSALKQVQQQISEVTKKQNKLKKNDYKDVPEHISEKMNQFIIWMKHKRYSENTISTYTDVLKQFLLYYKEREIRSLNNDDIVKYVHEHFVKNKLSFSYQNQLVNGVKLFFREVEKSKIEIEKVERPRREHKLPNVLSKEEVKSILEAPKNIKHKMMLSVIYACGLRRSELLFLKPVDVDSKRKLLIIKNAKGRKDRVAPISEKLIEMLREYYKIHKPKVWLFEGQVPGEQYSETSLQKVLKLSLLTAKIKKPVTLHWLRHSYATHLLESGTDIRYIQELLGHKSSKTTEIYTHVSTRSIQQIKSPFDDL
jgi:integrase/recombinase XerD